MTVNIGSILWNRAFLSPDLEACTGDGYRLTYAEVNTRANRFSGLLEERGIRRGDRIALLCKNNEHVISAMFGAAKSGVITVLLNWRLQAAELAFILSDCQASLLVYDATFAATVDRLREQVPISHFIRVGGRGTDPDFDACLDSASDAEPAISGGGDDPVILMYTSGTTGKPKGVTLTHNNCFWASIGLMHTIDWSYRYRFLSVAPLFHIGGMAPIFANVHAGCTSVFMPDFDPAAVWETIAAEKINFLMTVPLMLNYMKMVPGVAEMDLSSLKYIICGGSAVPRSLIESYLEMGIKVQHVYGATEYCGAISFWTHDMDFEKSDSMGKAVFHGAIKIFAPDGKQPLPAGDVGEICLFGPQVFAGYWRNERATREVLGDGFYRTGDLGRMDEQGFVYVVDRLKDMIISGGENIYPAEIEAVINTHPQVAEVAVAGRPDPRWGEIPVAFIVKKPDASLDGREIIDLCKNNLAGFKCVKEVIFTEALPKNSVGKVLKNTLRKQLAQS